MTTIAAPIQRARASTGTEKTAIEILVVEQYDRSGVEPPLLREFKDSIEGRSLDGHPVRRIKLKDVKAPAGSNFFQEFQCACVQYNPLIVAFLTKDERNVLEAGNLSVELGYAIGRHGDCRLLLVSNEPDFANAATGGRADPFFPYLHVYYTKDVKAVWELISEMVNRPRDFVYSDNKRGGFASAAAGTTA